jgi:putative membrane protein
MQYHSNQEELPMKQLLSRSLAAGAIVALAACGSHYDVGNNMDQADPNTMSPTASSTTVPTTNMASASTTTPPVVAPLPADQAMASKDIAAILFAANQGEVDQANAALPKLSSTDARDFANMMIADHTQALTNLRNITSVNNIRPHDAASDAAALRDQSRQLITNFNTSNGMIDRSYMAAQVQLHERLLTMLDTRLIPSSHGDLLTLLQNQRAAVATHLDRARSILANLP